MQFGWFTEFEWMAGHSEQEAFCTSLAQVDEAERLGFDEEVIAKIRWLQAETGCNNLLCWMNAGSRLTQEQVLKKWSKKTPLMLFLLPLETRRSK